MVRHRESVCILSEHSEESIHTGHSWTNIFQTSKSFSMDNQLRRQLIADLLTSSFDFDLLTSTAEWDELTCDEQMTLADLIDC